MAKYVTPTDALVALNGTIPFSSVSIPCNTGNVIPLAVGILNLKGNTPNRFARYDVTVQANVQIPTGGAVTPIAIGIAINGAVIPESVAIYTPAAVEEFFNVSRDVNIDVPAGCCVQVSVENTSDDDILVENANLIVERVA